MKEIYCREIKEGFLFIVVVVLIVTFFSPQTLFSQSINFDRQLRLEGIEIIGNTKTSANVIMRLLTIRPGDSLTPEIIETNRLRLSQSNFFKEVHVYTRPGSQKETPILVVEVKERRWPYFQFEGGYSDLDGWYLVPASLRFDNLFGDGSRFGLKWQLGDHITRLSLRYQNNIIADKLFLDVEGFAAGRVFVHYLNNSKVNQNVGSGGINIKIGGTKGILKYMFLAYRSETFDPKDYAEKEDGSRIDGSMLPLSIQDDLAEAELNSIGFGFYADTRDNPVYPLNGFWGTLMTEIADLKIDKSATFPKLTLDARLYKSVLNKSVFAFHLRSAFTTEDSPFYERYYLGGSNSLRGYGDRRLTPEGWGTKLIYTNTEFRFPLESKNFPYHKSTGVVFFDAGGLWQSGQKISMDDFFAAFGIGFRVKLPVVGITRFDFAFPLTEIDRNDYKFHITLGHTF